MLGAYVETGGTPMNRMKWPILIALAIRPFSAHAQEAPQQPPRDAPAPPAPVPAPPAAPAPAPPAAPAAAEPTAPLLPAPPVTASVAVDSRRQRHLGFYIRPDVGVGYLSSSESVGSTTVTISGFSGVAGLAIGAAVSENLILAAHIIDAVSLNPSVSLDGGPSQSTSNTSVVFWGIGPELTYYFEPANVYLSLTGAVTRMSFSAGSSGSSQTASTDWGFGGRAAVGKEWWVSDHWGLGMAGQVSFSSNPDPAANGSSVTMTTWSAGAMFSATYN
jgi:hypothetical protein